MKIKLLIFATVTAISLLTGCSGNEEASKKTEEEIRAEVKSELEAEQLNKESKQELVNESARTANDAVEVTDVKIQNQKEFVSPEPFVTSNVTFSNFDLSKQSDGYSLHMDIENTNDKYDVAFGWGRGSTATLVTTEGEYKDEFPHMEKLAAGETKNYDFKFKSSVGEPKELIIEDVNLVNLQNGKLPTPGKEESFNIPLK